MDFTWLVPSYAQDIIPDVNAMAAELDIPCIQTDAIHNIAGIGLGQELGEQFREVTQRLIPFATR